MKIVNFLYSKEDVSPIFAKKGLDVEKSSLLPDIYSVTCHTDHVGPGSTFIAIKGMKDDGLSYVSQALEKGAKTIIIENQMTISPELQNKIQHCGAQLQRVANTRLALALSSAQALNFPASKLKIIGITGTKGKTTTTFLIEHVLKTAGYKTALLSTVKNRVLTTDLPTQLTTQQPDYLHVFFDHCIKQKIEFVIMEIAAQALSLHRIAGIQLDGVVFTNFSQEHAEFYHSLDEYFDAKKSIVKHLKLDSFLCLNADDKRVSQLTANASCRYFSTRDSRAYAYAHLLNTNLQGLRFEINKNEGTAPALMGDFNLSNIAAATSCLKSLGLNEQQVVKGMATFPGVPGRLNRYSLPNKATAYIDYAHNPSSFEAVLSTLRTLTPHLIVLFGAGGNRDGTKRPVMGEIASRYADAIILTTDNPRFENPEEIMHALVSGIPDHAQSKIIVELDREKAIRTAYTLSNHESVIALLGKGPDEYQLVQGIKTFFSESRILQSLV